MLNDVGAEHCCSRKMTGLGAEHNSGMMTMLDAERCSAIMAFSDAYRWTTNRYLAGSTYRYVDWQYWYVVH